MSVTRGSQAWNDKLYGGKSKNTGLAGIGQAILTGLMTPVLTQVFQGWADQFLGQATPPAETPGQPRLLQTQSPTRAGAQPGGLTPPPGSPVVGVGSGEGQSGYANAEGGVDWTPQREATDRTKGLPQQVQVVGEAGPDPTVGRVAGVDEFGVLTPAMWGQRNPDSALAYSDWWRGVYYPMISAGFGAAEIPAMGTEFSNSILARGGYNYDFVPQTIPLDPSIYGGGSAGGMSDFEEQLLQGLIGMNAQPVAATEEAEPDEFGPALIYNPYRENIGFT